MSDRKRIRRRGTSRAWGNRQSRANSAKRDCPWTIVIIDSPMSKEMIDFCRLEVDLFEMGLR